MSAVHNCSALEVLTVAFCVLCGSSACVMERDHALALKDHPSTIVSLSKIGTERKIVNMPEGFGSGYKLAYAEAKLDRLKLSVRTTGQVQPDANAVTRISTPVSGRVTEVLVSVGDHVKAAQPLLSITSQDLEQMQAEMLKAQQEIQTDLDKELIDMDFQIKQAMAQLQLSFKMLDRAQVLVGEKIGSQAALDTTKTQYDKDVLTLDGLKKRREKTVAVALERKTLSKEGFARKLELLGMSRAAIDDVLRRKLLNPVLSVRTPHPGVVLERSVNVGELVDPGKLLFTVDDLDNVWLVAEVYEKDIPQIKIGQEVEFQVDSLPQRTFKGQLSHVAAAVNPETRTMSVRAKVQNPGMILKPKMFARMSIIVGERQVLSVPASAVQDAGSYKVVYIPLSRTAFEERQVKTGNQTGPLMEVVSGLSPGEKVVTSGTFELRAQSLQESD